MAREVDLATLRHEAEKEPVRIRIGDETFEGPSELPYPAFRTLGRLAGADVADPAVTSQVFDAVDETMGLLIGSDNWARIGRTVSSDDVMVLLQGILVAYGLSEKEATPEDALGESQASARP